MTPRPAGHSSHFWHCPLLHRTLLYKAKEGHIGMTAGRVSRMFWEEIMFKKQVFVERLNQ